MEIPLRTSLDVVVKQTEREIVRLFHLFLAESNFRFSQLSDFAASFEWSRNTPLTNPYVAYVFAPFGYLLLLVVLRLLVGGPLREDPTKERKPRRFQLFSLDGVAFFHNVFLRSLSVWMAVTGTTEILKLRHSGVDLTCQPGPNRGLLAFVFYVFHLSKYYELFDTVILVLKRKPLIFLHVWHHAIMVPLTFSWMDDQMTLQYWGVLFNSSVHVLMYFYYAASLLGINCFWKKYLTSLQIFQFVTVFGYLLIWASESFSIPILGVPYELAFNAHEFLILRIVRDGKCAGGHLSFLFSFFVNLTFLILFTNFFLQSYVRKPRQAGGGAGKGEKKQQQQQQQQLKEGGAGGGEGKRGAQAASGTPKKGQEGKKEK